MRWLVFWPAMVVIALNIESAATDGGLASLISEHWRRVAPVIDWFYGLILSPYLLLPAVFLLGATIYEIFVHRLHAISHFDGVLITPVTKFRALGLATAFKKKGFSRSIHKFGYYGAVSAMNDLLKQENLPIIPDEVVEDEQINKAFAQYLRMVGEGERGLCVDYYEKVILPLIDKVYPPQSPSGTATETPPKSPPG